MSPFVPAWRGPQLDVEVAALGVAGVADRAEPLAGEDVIALLHVGGVAQVHVRVRLAAALVHDDVVAGRDVVPGKLDGSLGQRGERRATPREGNPTEVPTKYSTPTEVIAITELRTEGSVRFRSTFTHVGDAVFAFPVHQILFTP